MTTVTAERIEPEPAADRLITGEQLRQRYGIPYTRPHLWRLARAGQFPAPVRLGENRIAYIEREIVEWIASRPRAVTVKVPTRRSRLNRRS